MSAPRWATWIVRWVAPPCREEEVAGDLEEAHRSRLMRRGRMAAAALTTVEALDVGAALLRERIRRRASIQHSPASGRRTMFDRLGGEVRQSIRGLLRTPVFTAAAVATLTLGIAATTAVYTVLENVVLRPLPYRDAEALVSVLHPTAVPGTGEAKWGMSAGGYFRFREASRTLEDLGGYWTWTTTVVDGGGPEQVHVSEVTASVFTTLRARPAVGRLLSAEDDRPGSPPVVVLSYEFWRRRFGGGPGVIGSVLHTSAGSFEIIGIAERGLTLPRPGPFASQSDLASFAVSLWLPLRLDPAGPFYNSHQYAGIGRLRPGATAAEATADLEALMHDFPTRFPQAYTERFLTTFDFRVAVVPLRDEVLGPTLARTIWVLFAAVGLVLLIAGANVANLFIVRLTVRRRDEVVRSALGASRADLALHRLVEAMLIAIGAAVMGLVAGYAGLRALLAIAPVSIPRLSAVHVHATTMLLTGALALLGGLAFGLLPSFRGVLDGTALREGGRGTTASPGQRRLRDGLLIGQVALALVLLTSAGLLLRSFANLRGVPPGLDPRGVLVFEAPLPRDITRSDESVANFDRALFERLAGLPGVLSVGSIRGLPLQDYTSGCTSVSRENRPFGPDEAAPCVATPYITPGLVEALSIPIVGRRPAWSDVDGPARVALVTRGLADRLWPGEDPIGKGLQEGNGPRGVWPRVIGVVPELRMRGLDRPPTEAAFFVSSKASASYVVRFGRNEPIGQAAAVRRILADLDPDVPMVNTRTMESVVAGSMARTSFLTTLLGISGVIALLLSAVGIYGVIAYMVGLRRNEIGVRLALGARRAQIARLVLGQSLGRVMAGIGVGLACALVVTRGLKSLLFGVTPLDPVVMLAATIGLFAVAALASYAPARQAAHRSPVEVLRP